MVSTSFFCYSQNLDEYNATYPKDDVITLSLNKHISITKSKSSLSIKEIVNRKDFYLTNKRLTHATESVHYNTFNTIKNITAFTENNISDKITKSFVRDFNDEDVLVRGVFYNDQKKKSFSFPNVNKGSITHLSYEKTINDPHFLPSFLISDNVPIEKAEVSISFPNDVDVAFTTFNLENIDTNFEEIKDSLIINIENEDGSDLMPLFISLKENIQISQTLNDKINKTLREHCSPRHVPDAIYEVPDIPYTLSGKKMEVPVKRLFIKNAPKKAIDLGSIKNPEAMQFFINLAKKGLS